MTRPQLVDLDLIAKELSELEAVAETRPVDYAQPRHRHETPDYVAHDERVSDIGAMTATAVIRMSEDTAKSIEQMNQQCDRIEARCEEVKGIVQETRLQVKQLADRVREVGAKKFAEVEEHAIRLDEMKQAALAMAQKIGVEINVSSS